MVRQSSESKADLGLSPEDVTGQPGAHIKLWFMLSIASRSSLRAANTSPMLEAAFSDEGGVKVSSRSGAANLQHRQIT